MLYGVCYSKKLDSTDQLLRKESDVTLIDESTQRYRLAMVKIDCSFLTGKGETFSMEGTLYDLVIGNIDESKFSDMSHFQLRQLLERKLIRKRLQET